MKKNTTTTTTESTTTRKNTNKGKGEKTMNKKNTTPATAPEKNTIPAPESTTTDTTEKKGEKNMNTTTENKNTTTRKDKKNTTTERKDTLPGNIEQAEKTLAGDVKALEKLLNTATLPVKVKEKRVTVGKDATALNKLLSIEYYRKTPLFDIVKNGESVPAVVIDENESGGKITLSIKKTKVYPTLSGMKEAGVISDEVLTRVDVLRRFTAFVKSGNTATVFLTGDTENKKDCPTEKAVAMIEKIGTPSKNKARALLTQVFSDLTGEKYKKEVLPKLYEEFETYITRRSRKWSERNMVSKNTAGDMALEFAWMYFNGKTAFKYTGI